MSILFVFFTGHRLPDSAPTYRYVFHHRQSFLIEFPDWVNGSNIDDIYSIFGEPFMLAYRRLYLKEEFDALDTLTSERIMNYYSNFAHSGSDMYGICVFSSQWLSGTAISPLMDSIVIASWTSKKGGGPS